MIFIYEVSKYHPMNLVLEMNKNKDVFVVDSGSSHTILRDKRYFINLTLKNANISTIAGIASLIEATTRLTFYCLWVRILKYHMHYIHPAQREAY